MPEYPQCAAGDGPITERRMAQGGGKTYHLRCVPGSARLEVPQSNIFGFHPVTGPIRRRIAQWRVRRQLKKGKSPAEASAFEVNPKYPARRGKAFERKWERMVLAIKKRGGAASPWAVATARLGGYPASRAAKNPLEPLWRVNILQEDEGGGEPFIVGHMDTHAPSASVAKSVLDQILEQDEEAVGQFAGQAHRIKGNPHPVKWLRTKHHPVKRAKAFGAKHPKGVKYAKMAGKAGLAVTTVVLPEVGVPASAAVAGVSRARAARKKNPLVAREARSSAPKTAKHYLELAERQLAQGHLSLADDYATKASQHSGNEGEMPPKVDDLLRRIHEAVEARGFSSEGSSKRAQFIRNPVTAEPPTAFFEKVADELRSKYPRDNFDGLFQAFKDIWRFALSPHGKAHLIERFQSGKPILDVTFSKLFEDYRAGKFVADSTGHLVPSRNPGDGLPVVDGATLVNITYRDENGVLWTHDSGERTGRKPKLRVHKGLVRDTVSFKTKVRPEGITD